MRPLPLETRRAIIQAKLSGASNREVADEFDVSIGTVSNVIDEARRGEIEGFESLGAQLDALIDLGKRLDEVDLDVTTAHIGLDVYSWITELGLDPADIEQLKADLERVTGEHGELTRTGPAMRMLLSLEQKTGLSVEDRLGELLELLADREPETVQRLADLAQQAEALPGGVDQLESAVEHSVEIQELGFDLDTAHRLAAELESFSTDGRQAAIETLVEVYDEYGQLSEAVDDLRGTKESLEADCETLRESRRDLEEHQEQLQESIQRAERALDSLEETQEELRATNEDLRDDIAHQRERLESIESDLEAKRSELEAIQREREVVHTYRRFLRDADLSDRLLLDLDDLLRIRDGEADNPLEELAADAEQRTLDELRDLAMDMLKGEEMMPVAEHERKLREKGHTEQTLEELQAERDAILAFLDFLDTGEISERLLKELRDLKRGRSNLPRFSEERKSEEVRNYLVEQLKAFTEGESVISERKHRELLLEERARHQEQRLALIESMNQLTGFIDDLPRLLGDEWINEIAQQVIEDLDDTQERFAIETLQEAFQQVIADEFDRRLNFDPDTRLPDREVLEGGVGAGHTLYSSSNPSNADEE